MAGQYLEKSYLEQNKIIPGNIPALNSMDTHLPLLHQWPDPAQFTTISMFRCPPNDADPPTHFH